MEYLNNLNLVAAEQIEFISSFFSFILAALFGWLITRSYRYASLSISGGKQVENSLLPLSLIICLIITIVKASLALSLGLVGALSIVRFRTPIKDPEDLIYLFLSIVTGIGFGANQDIFTSIGLSIILLILNIRFYFKFKTLKRRNNLVDFYLNIQWEENNKIKLSEIIENLSNSCRKISLIRFESIHSTNNILLQISIYETRNIDSTVRDLKKLSNDFNIQINNSRIEY